MKAIAAVLGDLESATIVTIATPSRCPMSGINPQISTMTASAVA